MFYDDVKKIVKSNIIQINDIIRYGNFVIIFVPSGKNKHDELNNKRRMYAKRGNNVVVVYEDEYLNHKDTVLSNIKQIIKK